MPLSVNSYRMLLTLLGLVPSHPHASMNHVAFDVASDKIEEYHQRLTDAGVGVLPLLITMIQKWAPAN